jgi:hypothetical protein
VQKGCVGLFNGVRNEPADEKIGYVLQERLAAVVVCLHEQLDFEIGPIGLNKDPKQSKRQGATQQKKQSFQGRWVIARVDSAPSPK